MRCCAVFADRWGPTATVGDGLGRGRGVRPADSAWGGVPVPGGVERVARGHEVGLGRLGPGAAHGPAAAQTACVSPGLNNALPFVETVAHAAGLVADGWVHM